MRKEYKLTEDIFLALATFLIGAAVVLKLFGLCLPLGFTVIHTLTLLRASVVCLLFNIALNVQEIARK